MEERKYEFGNRTVVWLWDKSFPGNNVKIYEGDKLLWSLNDVLVVDDCATSFEVLDDHRFKVFLFNGLSLVVDVNECKVIEKTIAK